MQGYDEQTEVLTTDGWIPFKRLDTDYQVATLVDGSYLVYEHPTAVYAHDYKGFMHRFKTANIDLLVTPDQKLWVSELGPKQFNLVAASEVADRPMCFELDINEIRDGSTSEFFTLPECMHYPAKQLDLSAWLLLYGTFAFRGLLVGQSVGLTLASVRAAEDMRTACMTLGFAFREQSNDQLVWTFDDPQLYAYLSNSPRALGSWVWDLDTYHADELLDNIMCSGRGDDRGYVLRASHRDPIDAVQRLSVHAGLVTITSREGSSHLLRVQHVDDVNPIAPLAEIVQYRGKVYGCKVVSGVICVRRNGVIGFSGAC